MTLEEKAKIAFLIIAAVVYAIFSYGVMTD